MAQDTEWYSYKTLELTLKEGIPQSLDFSIDRQDLDGFQQELQERITFNS